MALILKDRVKETTSTTGTGAISLGGAVANFQAFSAVLSDTDTTYYAIIDVTNSDYEVGLGTYSSGGNTLARTTILESSNGGSAVNFGAGSKNVFIAYPAEKSVYLDDSNQLVINSTAVTSTPAELNLVDGSSAGTIVNSKAVVYGASGEVNATTLQIGGTSITSTAAEINLLDGVTATTAEINYLDVTTLGTSEASKAVTADSNAKVTFIGTTSVAEMIEKVDISTSTTGTINFDLLSQAVQLYNTDQTANRTINFRGDGSNSLDSIMAIGESMTAAVLMKQGGTAYYLNTYQVDGSGVTPEWSGGTAPSAGNASSIDAYVFTIIKTASATFTVLASQTQYA
jgi:hypothetical protein